MQHLLDFAGAFAPFLMLALMLAALVLAINTLGRRLEKHDDWLRMLDVRLHNLHKARQATWARQLERPFALEPTEKAPLVPPPLPPRAPTLGALDWRDDNLPTDDLHTRQTGSYPGGKPPKGPSNDDER